METPQLLALIFLIAFGLIFGTLTARSSNQREKLHGNALSRLFHYIASALMAGLTPAVLILAIVFELGIVTAFGIAVAIVILAIILLIPHAILEQPFLEKLAKKEDRGWTAEDAKTSGL